MKKVHIISLGDTYMFRLAVALREKGYSVSCSGADIMGAEADILREKDILLADLQPISDPFKEKSILSFLRCSRFLIIRNLFVQRNPGY